MRWIKLIFVLCIVCAATAAQEKKDGASQPAPTVLINGQIIRGKVLEVDGKHFIAVEDLAQSLRGSIAYSDGGIALTLNKIPSPPAPAASIPSSATATPMPPIPAPRITAAPLESGRIKGSLTYFFDFHAGNKPDAGTKVWLVKGHAEVPANQRFVASSTALGTAANPDEYSVIKFSTADKNGDFEMADIPGGQYTLVLQSAHTKWTLNDKRDFFGRGNGHNPRDSDGRVEFLSVTVKPGETADASKDFGPNVDN